MRQRAIHRVMAVAVAVMLVLLPPCSRAGGLEEALDARKRGDFATAHKSLTVLAEAGNMDAVLVLARMYDTGEGGRQNDSLAWSWYQRAAMTGREEAMFRVGEFFESGRGIPASPKDAAEWFEKAAKKGHVGAMAKAGRIFALGIGVQPDVPKAVPWLLRAQEEEGNPEAETVLAALAARGLVVSPVPPGETEPKDERAAKALKDARTILEPYLNPSSGTRALKLGGELRVLEQDGGFMVFLPAAEVTGFDEGTLVVGTLRLFMVPETEDLYRIEATLPARMRVVDPAGKTIARVAIGRQSAKGTWSMAQGTATQADVSFHQVTMNTLTGDAADISIGTIASKLVVANAGNGLLDMEETLDFDAIEVKSRDTGDSLNLATFSAGNTIKGLDPAAYRRTLLSLGGGQEKPGSMSDIADGISATLSLNGLRLIRGGAAMGIGLTRLTLAAEGIRQPLGLLRLGIESDDLEAPPDTVDAALTPKTFAFRAVADRIPMRKIGEIAQLLIRDALVSMIFSPGLSPEKTGREKAAPPPSGVDAMLAALVEAGTELRLEKTGFSADAYDIRVFGTLKPLVGAPVPGTGDVQVDVRGLDALLAAFMREGQKAGQPPDPRDTALAAAIEGAGRKGTDEKGRPILSYRITLAPEGGIKINGRDVADILGGPAPAGAPPGRKKSPPPPGRP